ncbi:hypothetical protein Tco_0140961 [Tanacetum coccineum]
MSRSSITGRKNQLTKACLIYSQVAITPVLSSLNHTLASPAMDDGKSLSLIASALVRIFNKKDKNKGKADQTEHENGMSVRKRVQRYKLLRIDEAKLEDTWSILTGGSIVVQLGNPCAPDPKL